MKVKIEHDYRLNNHSFHSQRKPHWRLYRKEKGERIQVDTPPVRGDHKFNSELDLNAGYYILALGTGSKLYERSFFISQRGEVKWFEDETKRVA